MASLLHTCVTVICFGHLVSEAPSHLWEGPTVWLPKIPGSCFLPPLVSPGMDMWTTLHSARQSYLELQHKDTRRAKVYPKARGENSTSCSTSIRKGPQLWDDISDCCWAWLWLRLPLQCSLVMLASQDRPNKVPQPGEREMTVIDSLTVLESKSLKSRSWQGHALSAGSREGSFLASSSSQWVFLGKWQCLSNLCLHLGLLLGLCV